jgi:hypothetical protein
MSEEEKPPTILSKEGQRVPTGLTKTPNIYIGWRYRVTIDDCCVKGHFEAELKSAEIEADDDIATTFVFDNGVTLTEANMVEFEELKLPTGAA